MDMEDFDASAFLSSCYILILLGPLLLDFIEFRNSKEKASEEEEVNMR